MSTIQTGEITKEISEGSARVVISAEEKISRELPVFYNPNMKLNRDISILLLNAAKKSSLRIALPLAGTGVRGIRFLKELKSGKVESILINDGSPLAVENIKKNFILNNIDVKDPMLKVTITQQSASLLLLSSRGFDYIDIDPFGSPNPFLDAAVRSLSCEGILAVTATDTSALAGTHPKACLRKYGAVPLRTGEMHEVGVRILIRKVQQVAVQYDKALVPIFSYSKEHYVRIFFQSEKGKKACDAVLAQHGMYKNAGPLWRGKLWKSDLIAAMIEENKLHALQERVDEKFLETLAGEADVDVVGFYDIHALCKREKLAIPRYELLMEKLKEQKFHVVRTHFNLHGIKTDASEESLVKIIRGLGSSSKL